MKLPGIKSCRPATVRSHQLKCGLSFGKYLCCFSTSCVAQPMQLLPLKSFEMLDKYWQVCLRFFFQTSTTEHVTMICDLIFLGMAIMHVVYFYDSKISIPSFGQSVFTFFLETKIIAWIDVGVMVRNILFHHQFDKPWTCLSKQVILLLWCISTLFFWYNSISGSNFIWKFRNFPAVKHFLHKI